MPPNRLRSSGPTTTARSNPFGLIGSVLLHGGIVAATVFSFSHTLDINVQDVPVVPVELVTLADTTNITAQSPELPKPDLQETTPVQEVPPPPPPEKVEVAPDVAPKVAEKKPEPKTPPKPKEDKFDINKLVAMLDKKAAAAAPKNAKLADTSVKGVGLQSAMTANITAALTSQVFPCYNTSASAFSGAPRMEEDLVADFDVFLNPDGSVAQPPQLIGIANPGNPYAKVAEDAIRRAIYACAPYKLPANKYDQWREIRPWHFNPRQLGQ